LVLSKPEEVELAAAATAAEAAKMARVENILVRTMSLLSIHEDNVTSQRVMSGAKLTMKLPEKITMG